MQHRHHRLKRDPPFPHPPVAEVVAAAITVIPNMRVLLGGVAAVATPLTPRQHQQSHQKVLVSTLLLALARCKLVWKPTFVVPSCRV